MRGTVVNYGEDVINAFFGLKSRNDGTECYFSKKMKSLGKTGMANLDQIAPTFGVLNPPKKNSKGMIASTKKLEPKLNYLHRFICEKIIPSTRPHQVQWKRAFLMHYIVQKAPLTLGES